MAIGVSVSLQRRIRAASYPEQAMATDRVTLILCVVSCAVAFGASAAVYKWTDEQGVTHYGEKPPPNQKAQQLQIRTAPPPSTAPTGKEGEKDKPAAAGWQEQQREFQQRRIERLEKEQKEQEQEAKVRAEAKERCRSARYDLDIMSRSAPVYRLDEKGERKYYDDKTRAEIVARAKKDIAAYCKG